MQNQTAASIESHFAWMDDPRIDRTKDHPLINILVIAICGVISGADGWTDIEDFGKAKQDWFSRFLDLKNGIPSHDTLGRVFGRIDPEQFQQGFLSWMQAVQQVLPGTVIPIDGKQLRGSHDRKLGKNAIYMVSAWSEANHLVLGQYQVDEKSNEITAIPKLLNVLDITGCIVTIDAMGCQTEIATQIVDGGGDYLLALKGNQGRLHEDTVWLFSSLRQNNFAQVEHDFCQIHNQGHGRIEARQCWTIDPHQWPEHFRTLDDWKDIQSIAMIHSERREGDKVTQDTRYYISSLEPHAETILHAKRAHWGIENGLHWVLDIAFREDASRIRTDHAPANMAVLRHIALNLLKQEATSRRGVRAKRLRCGWDESYLLKVLKAGFH